MRIQGLLKGRLNAHLMPLEPLGILLGDFFGLRLSEREGGGGGGILFTLFFAGEKIYPI